MIDHVAEVVVACSDLDAARAGLRRHGFRIEMIFPADGPSVMVLSGHGLRIRLVRDADAPRTVRLAITAGATETIVAGETRIELVPVDDSFPVPELRPSFVVNRAADSWHEGRAGMQYRDLIPDRQGGRFIASHIRIPGGPVPDYVHYHEIRFHLIYCYRGWVRGVYEDQGEPFEMRAGDCVVQPPRIRHRVLESSPGLEVIEIGSPALHMTRADHDLVLPTPVVRPDRDFDGMRFAWHHATPGPRDLEVSAATGGLATAHVRGGGRPEGSHDRELLFGFVLEGSVTLASDGEHRLGPADAFVVPPGQRFSLTGGSPDLEWLEVTA